ncbi:hypothetical protein EPJ79_00840 [Brachyspira aalborgi]|uniref:Lipocalin-like domain-containing protein n=1 Tax=Brachyspira aalborgi TaxID=29522 RepID=A0A5C8D2Q4_9SPIR|nr:hypothetical protein [Brachyspira aalborgi]TXJ19737.1 hypothetical protein EPJ79_00840 [Brachyspira aalborgi]
MKNSKKLFLIFLSVLIVAFVSCKKDSGGSITTPTPTFKPSSLAGKWTSGSHTFTMGNDGKITGISIDGISIGDYTITDWDKDKDTEVPKYTVTINNQSSGGHTYDFAFTFTSGSNCIVTRTEQGQTPGTFTFTKEATPTTK